MIRNSITSIVVLKTIQRIFPLSILSTSFLNDFGFKQGFYSSKITIKIPDFDAQILYIYDDDLKFIPTLMLNLKYLDISKIMKLNDGFDDQHDKLDGIFQGIRILNNIPNPEDHIVKASEYLQAKTIGFLQETIGFLQECSRKDPYQDYIFGTLLDEIHQGKWRSNVYFDKLY